MLAITQNVMLFFAVLQEAMMVQARHIIIALSGILISGTCNGYPRGPSL